MSRVIAEFLDSGGLAYVIVAIIIGWNGIWAFLRSGAPTSPARRKHYENRRRKALQRTEATGPHLQPKKPLGTQPAGAEGIMDRMERTLERYES